MPGLSRPLSRACGPWCAHRSGWPRRSRTPTACSSSHRTLPIVRRRRVRWRTMADEISGRLPAAPARRQRVLVTGATGYIASQLLPLFRQRYDLVALDVRTSEGVAQANLLEDDL